MILHFIFNFCFLLNFKHSVTKDAKKFVLLVINDWASSKTSLGKCLKSPGERNMKIIKSRFVSKGNQTDTL